MRAHHAIAIRSHHVDHRVTVWEGNYHNTTDSDRGTFKFILETRNFWAAKSKFGDGRFGVQGTAVTENRCKDKISRSTTRIPG